MPIPLQMSSSDSDSDAGALLGRTEPRLFTPPLRRLTPDTSYGFDVIRFAEIVLKMPLDPWQQWLVIHAGELLPDGRPRFRKVLVVVARQNGKTHVLLVLTLFWLFSEMWDMILGTSTTLDYAAEPWQKAIDAARRIPALRRRLKSGPTTGVREANGEREFVTGDGCRYKIAAMGPRAGRSLSIDRLVLDEVRQHLKWSTHDAAVNAMQARPHAQAFMISNQGGPEAVVLDFYREAALAMLAPGAEVLDPRLGFFEWSPPDGVPTDSMQAAAWANPNLGRRVDVDAIRGAAALAHRAGGEALTGYLTEVLCIKVASMDPAIDVAAWGRGAVPGSLDRYRRRLAAVLDVAPDGKHATLCAGADVGNGVTRVEIVRAWGPDEVGKITSDVRRWVRKHKPRAFGWFPNGPAAAVSAELADRGHVAASWPPIGVDVAELRGEVAAICMGFAQRVAGGQVVHSAEPLLDDHVRGATKHRTGDVWRFARGGVGHVDAAYAAAGVDYLVRAMPPPVGDPRLVGPD